MSNYRISKISKPQLDLNSQMAWLNPQRKVKGKTEGIDGSFFWVSQLQYEMKNADEGRMVY